jgi:hypothetical protein
MKTVRSRAGITARFIAAAALGLTGLAVATAPAANSATWSGYGNNTVGVQQVISLQGVCPTSSAQISFSAQYTNGTVSNAPAVNPASDGSATIYWTPMQPGQITQATVNTVCGPIALGGAIIAKANTTTTVVAPNTAVVGQSTRIQVNVQSQSPSSTPPTGTITVTNANGAPYSQGTNMGLTAGPGNGQSYAYFWWTPPAAGTYYFQAQYNGDSNTNGSTMSPLDTLIATPSGGTISINAPSTMTQGQSVTLTATVFPAGTQGSVGFTINGAPISASIPINAQGQASFVWPPNVVGQVTLGANYTTNQGGSGSTSELITIIAGPVQQDVITLVQPGWGPWNPNGTYTLGNGSSFAFQASSLSGAAVTLSETGPCQINGLTITVPVGSGQCNLQAATNGGNGYGPVKTGYTVNLIPGIQQATLNAPPSGSFKVGRVIVLESPSQQNTSAGQNISWSVKKGGKAICKLLYQNDGSVTLRIAKRGTCTVVGSAAAVPGQWQPFQTARNYTGR